MTYRLCVQTIKFYIKNLCTGENIHSDMENIWRAGYCVNFVHVPVLAQKFSCHSRMCHKYPLSKVVVVRIIPEALGKVSSNSTDIQTHSWSSQDSTRSELSRKSILAILGYSDILRNLSIPPALNPCGKVSRNSGILSYTQDHSRIPPALDSHGKVSLKFWNTQDHPRIPLTLTLLEKHPRNTGIFRHTRDHPRIPFPK